MLQNGAEQLVLKLEQLFQGKEEQISSGKLRVCLTASIIVFLNKCFEDTEQHSGSLNRIIDYLKQCVQTVHTLKIVRGPTFKFTTIIDISHFQAVQVLQVEKIAVGYVSGLQTLRSRIKVLKPSHCLDTINDILTRCGYDLSNAFTWPQLEVADFSFNTISYLDSSLRLLTSVRCLNLSHNELTSKDEDPEEDEWMFLPEVRYLDLGYNLIKKIPSFPENCASRITTLILQNNDLSNIEGVEMLPNLEALDVSTNCICNLSSFSSLVQLHRLVSVCCYSNPISYDKRYRNAVVSCLSPSPRQVPIVLDGKELSAKELYNLGQSLEVDLNSYIPSRPFDTPVHMFSEACVSSGEVTEPRTPEEKRKSRRSVVRQPSIHDVGDEIPKLQKPRSLSVTAEETNEELEKLEKFKKDAGEDYLVVRNQEQLNKNIQEFVVVSSTGRELEQPSTSSDFANPATEDLEVISCESPPVNKTEMQEVTHDVESGRMFHVSVKPPNDPEENNSEMYVTVKGHEIVEKDDVYLKETSRLDLKGLLKVDMINYDEKMKVILKFSHVHKERKYREYIFDDDEQSERFISLLKQYIKEQDHEKIIPLKQFKCMKCSECYTTKKVISRCTYCGSSFVVEMTKDDSEPTKLPPDYEPDVTRNETGIQNLDLIPNTVCEVSVPPDICIAFSGNDKDTNTKKSTDENTSELDSEYGALVSSIRVKSKETCYEDSYSSEDREPQAYSLTQGQYSPSAAMNISVDRFSKTRSRRFCGKLRQGSESPLTSSYSSQSGSETRSSTPFLGNTSARIHFSLDSCTHCDHRLKLYLETKLFRGGEVEEFCCMIKCPVASYGYTQGIPSLLVISNSVAYICKITGFESTRPKDWLSIRTCHLLTDLRYIEYGLQSQSFRLEFAEQFGCHTFLVGDRKRCENFITTLRSVTKNNNKPVRIGKANPQTRANIRIQVLGVKDESLMFKGRRLYEQAVNFTDPPLVKDRKVWFRSLPQSMQGEEFIDWLITRKEASSYREAVHIGQLLLDAGAIQCYNKDCGFLEKDQYYHFDLSAEEHEDDVNDEESSTSEPEQVHTTLKQYILGFWKDEEKSTPISMIITDTHVALAEENHQWPLPRLHDPPKILSGPQFVLKKKQNIINITDVELFTESPCEIGIEFRDEDTPESIEDDRWLIVLHSEDSLTVLLDAIKELWEDKFGIDLQVNVLNTMA